MKLHLVLAAVLLLAGCSGSGVDDGFPVLTGDYLGQTPPGEVAELFAPGIVTTGMDTRDIAMTPDGNEIYFCVSIANYSYTAILVSKRTDGRWSKPEVAPFSGNPDWMDIEPFISPDGEQFYFLSTRPDGDEEPGDQDIWVMDRAGDGWSEPRNLGLPVNTEAGEFFPSITRDGTLYFTRSDPETREHTIWRARQADGLFQEPEKLGVNVNAGRMRFNASIAPDESYIMIPIVGLDDSRGGTDYYISFRNEDDTWTVPVNMGDQVNSDAAVEWSSYVSPDGKYLFFMSNRTPAGDDASPSSYRELLSNRNMPGNGGTDIYWMEAGFIEDLRAAVYGKGDEFPGAGEQEPRVIDPQVATTMPAGTPPYGELFPVLQGEYLGQTPPGTEPELFAPGIVSNALTNRDLAISPDGKEIFFGVGFGRTVAVLHTRLEDGGWTEPDFAPFSRDPEFACFEPALSADGRTLFFLTNRPAEGQEQRPGWGNQNIFSVSREDDGWSEPVALPAPVTTGEFEYYPSLTRDGTLYFTKDSPRGRAVVARSRLVNGKYEEPEVLGPEVNIGEGNYNTFVAPDESYLITCVQENERNIGEADYYISFRREDDTWTEAINMGEPINRPGTRAISSSVSPDGKYLFFASDRTDPDETLPSGRLTWDGLLRLHNGPQNGSSDIYWVETGFIEELRAKHAPAATPGT